MTVSELFNAGRVAVNRNISPSITGALIGWEPIAAKLTLLYLTRDIPSSEDRELCELALCDLIAEFAEIESAEGDVLHEAQATFVTGMQRVFPLPP